MDDVKERLIKRERKRKDIETHREKRTTEVGVEEAV